MTGPNTPRTERFRALAAVAVVVGAVVAATLFPLVPVPPASPDPIASVDPESDPSDLTDSRTAQYGEIDRYTDRPATPAEVGAYSVAVDPSPVPGRSVTVTVRRDGAPVGDLPVRFGGDRVGRTDADGTVDGRVPYAPRFVVAADVGERVGEDDTVTVAYDVPTAADVTLRGSRVPGDPLSVTAHVQGVPVRNTRAWVDGVPVARVDSEGRTNLTVPDTAQPVNVTVSRGPVSGNATFVPDALRSSVRPVGPLGVAVPGGSVAVEATVGGDPRAGLPVSVDGQRVAETNSEGVATVSLPVAQSASVAVRGADQRTRTRVGGLFTNLLVLLGALAVPVALGVVAFRRGDADDTAGPLPGFLSGVRRLAVGCWSATAAAVSALASATVAGGFRAADLLGRGLSRLGDALGRAHHLGLTIARRTLELALGTVAAVAALPGALAHVARSPGLLLTGLAALVSSGVGALGARTGGVDLPVSLPAIDHESSGAPKSSPAGSASADRTLVRDAWRSVVDRVPLRRPEATTPAEVARRAVASADLSPEAVRTLRDAFRDVEYGGDPGEVHADRVVAARDAIERDRDGDAGDADGGDGR